MIDSKLLSVKITGLGTCLPVTEVKNDDLSQIVDTNDEWIASRTGIRSRYIANKDETSGTLATEAAKKALSMANLAPEDVDLVIAACSIGDYVYPSTACVVQGAIGAKNAAAYDMVAACSGFVYGLNTAAAYIRSGIYKNIVLIGVDIHSKVVDWTDRGTCVLFGDGAGAFVLQAGEGEDELLATDIGADGSNGMVLTLPFQGQVCPLVEQKEPQAQLLGMNGKEVYKFAVTVVPQSIQRALAKAGLTVKDVDYLVPHQANMRIITAIQDRLKIDEEKVLAYLDRFGNTSAASIPIVLATALEEGRLKPNSTMVLCGFGAGLTWGSAVIKWNLKK